jgi:hypothetical protein
MQRMSDANPSGNAEPRQSPARAAAGWCPFSHRIRDRARDVALVGANF